MDKPRPIIVIGPERSGTSVVAEMICRWGAYPGKPDRLREADSQNPNGYFEYLPIWDFLADLGVNWWDAGFQDSLEGKASVAEHRRKARELVAEMEDTGRPWVWKDPALSFFLPFWKRIWTKPIFVVTVRNPIDTAMSWQKFILPPEARGCVAIISANLLRWHYIMSIVLENTEDTRPKFFISFERLLTDPGREARRLGEFLSSECGEGESRDQSWTAMAEAVCPELWSHRSQTPFDETPQASGELKQLYRFALMKTESPFEPFRLPDYPMYPGWRESVTTSETLARMCREEAGRTNA